MRDSTLRGVYRRMAGERGRRLLRSYQDGLLRREVAHAAANSPYYRRRFAEERLDPRAVRSADDLPRLGLFTHPAELRADPFRFLAVPREQLVYAIPSSGTTGKAKIVFFTKRDWQATVGTVSVGLALMGLTSADVGHIVFAYGSPIWPTGLLVQSALERLGAFVLPVGNAVSVEHQLDTMRTFGSTALFGTPTYVHRLTEEGRRLCDLRSLGVRLLRLGSEPWSEELRAYLEEAWGAPAYDTYGMIELGVAGAGECRERAGLHLSPYVLAEVVDPATGAPLPRGELGELVFTTLLRQATPLLRYRSGDLARLLPDEPCSCGEVPTQRISRIVGRTDDMLSLGTGENTFPTQFEAALTGVDGLAGFQVVLHKAGYRDRVRVRVEAIQPSEALAEQIRARLYAGIDFLYHEIHHAQSIAPLEVEFLPPGALQAESPAKQRAVIDRRGSGPVMGG